jgi:hypothetical protein
VGNALLQPDQELPIAIRTVASQSQPSVAAPRTGPEHEVGRVQRQYSGTAGRIENCQLGAFVAYAVPDGGLDARPTEGPAQVESEMDSLAEQVLRLSSC